MTRLDAGKPKNPERRYITLYGERNTGSRYLNRLLELNLEAACLEGTAPRWVALLNSASPDSRNLLDWYFSRTFAQNLGWKHSQVQVGRLLDLGGAIRGVHFVTLIKNPYSWLLSLAKRPYHRKPAAGNDDSDLESLLLTQWATVGRDNGPPAYRDAIDLWNSKVRSYIELAERLPTTFLTYEDLVADPAAALKKIKADSADEWSGSDFQDLQQSTKEKGKDSSFYRRYYGEELWREQLNPRVIGLINERLDPALMALFGYRILDT